MITNLVPLFAIERCKTQLAQIAALVHVSNEGCDQNQKAILHLVQNIERDLQMVDDVVPYCD